MFPARAPEPVEHPKRRGVALIVTVAAWLSYMVAFLPVAHLGGTGASALLVFVPVGVTGWFYGLWGGLAAGLVAYVTNLVFHVSHGGPAADMVDFGYLVGHSVLLAFGTSLGYVRDVSARYRAELQERHRIETVLAASEEQFRVAFQDAPTGIAVLGTDGVITRSNRTFGSIVGSRRPEGVSLGEFLVEHDRWAEMLDALRSGATDVGEAEFSVTGPGGSSCWVTVIARVIWGSLGVIGILCHVQDVTERVEANRRLEELVRSKDEFVASVSHELRTPLTAVLGFAQELQASSGDPALTGEFLSAIVEQADELSAIVEDLLVAARAEIGTITLRAESLTARQVIDPLVSDITRWGASPVEIEGDGHIVADRTRLRQVLRNLVSNAERYGGPRIRVTVTEDGHETVIAVVDDGGGIPPEAEETIFEPYGTADHGVDRNPASIGLGLSISRMLAHLMGGRLEYRRVGGETQFRLTLPSRVASEPVSSH